MRQRWIALLSLLLVLGLFGCKTDQDRRDEHLARADGYLQEGQVKEALLELRNALQRDPQNADINLEIAKILERTERASDAFFFYEEAHRLDTENGEAALGVARLGAFEDAEQATRVVDALLEREPSNVAAHAQKSQLQLIEMDLAGALASALVAVELGPDDPGALMQLGRVHQARIVEAREILKVDPEAAIFESAIAAFERAAERSESDVKLKALFERARVYSTWPDREDEALDAHRELVAIGRESGRKDLEAKAAALSIAYARQIEDDDFLRWSLQQLVVAHPARLQAWRELADLSEQEEEGTGTALLLTLVEERSDDTAVHLLYSGFLDGLGRREDSLAHLESVLGTVEAPAQILGALVTMRLATGQTDDARTAATRLTEEFPAAPEARFARGQLQLKDGEVTEAIDTFSRLGSDTGSPEAYRLLAQAELRSGRTVQAVAAIDRALELAGNPSLAMLQTEARVAFASGSWTRVIAAFNAIQRRGVELRAREYFMSALAYLGAGRRGRGLSVLGDLTLTEPPYVPAVIELVRRAPKDVRPFARERLGVALEEYPDDPRLLVAFASLDVRDGNDARALQRLEQALEGGADANALTLRSRVRARLGDEEGAIEDALAAFQVQPSSDNARALAATYQAAGRLEEAVASFEEAAEVGALGVEALPVLARLQLASGKTAEAIATFEKVLEARPEATGVKNDLAFLLADEEGGLERALALAQEAQSEAPELAPVADTLGYVYMKKEMFAPAEKQFRYAIELDGARSTNPAYRYHLALVLGRQGRHSEAIEALEAVLALEGEFEEEPAARRELEAARAALEEVANS